MYIESININKFSGVGGVKTEPGPGLNVIYGKNETGKSSISAFIKYIFYGFDNKSERLRYTGWGEESVSGSICLRDGDRSYRISRETFASGREKVQVTDLSTNTELRDADEPGMYFFGIPENVFESTVYVRQIEGAGLDGEHVGKVMENILYAADERVDSEKAKKKLDDLRTSLLYKNGKGGAVYESEKKLEELSARISQAEKDAAAIQERRITLDNIKRNYENNISTLKRLGEEIKAYECGLTAKRYSEAKAYKAKYEGCNLGISMAKAKYGKDDFVPDREWLARLEDCAAQRASLDKEHSRIALAAAENERDGDDAESRRSRIAELQERGGADAVISDLRRHTAAKKFFAAAALIFLAGAAAAAILLPGMPYVYIPAAVLAVVFAILFLTNRSYVQQLLAGYGASGERTLRSTLDDIEKDGERLESFERRAAELRGQSSACDKVSAELEEKIAELVRTSGKEDLAQAIQAARSAVSELEKLESEKEKYAVLFENTYAPLREYTKFDLEETIKHAPDGEWMEKYPYNESKKTYNTWKENAEKSRERKEALEREIISLEARAENCESLYDERAAEQARLEEKKRRYDAVIMAQTALEGARADMRDGIGPMIAADAGKLLGKLSGGKYSVLGINGDNGIEYSPSDGVQRNRSISWMSAGTADMTYLALRLALAKLIGRDKTLPLIFDESFVRLDDMRLDSILELLAERTVSEGGTQALIFTSHMREAEHMKKISDFTLTKL